MQVGPCGGCVSDSETMGTIAVGNMIFQDVKQLSVKFRREQSPGFSPLTP